MTRLLALLMLLASWGLLAYGAAEIYRPAGWLVLGACIWVDLYVGRRLRGAR